MNVHSVYGWCKIVVFAKHFELQEVLGLQYYSCLFIKQQRCIHGSPTTPVFKLIVPIYWMLAVPMKKLKTAKAVLDKIKVVFGVIVGDFSNVQLYLLPQSNDCCSRYNLTLCPKYGGKIPKSRNKTREGYWKRMFLHMIVSPTAESCCSDRHAVMQGVMHANLYRNLNF